MTRYLFILLFGVVFVQCQSNQKELTHKTDPEVFDAIKSVLQAQEDAWNEGDIEKFMEGYWKSEELVFIGSRGVTNGWQTTLDNYKKGYPDRKTMGKLKFDIVKLSRLSDEVCQMIGKYTLFREEDEPSGYFTLIWQLIDGNWVITSDQTCG